MDDNLQKKLDFALNAFKVLGYFESPFFSKLFRFFYLVVLISILSGSIIGFINREIIFERIEILYSLTIITLVFGIYMTGRNYHKQLNSFIFNISHNQSTDNNIKSEVFQLTIKNAEKILPKFMIFKLCLGVMILLSWCFTPLINNFDYRNKNIYTLPYLFKCSDHKVNQFPTVTFLCVKEETFSYFLFSNILMLIGGVEACFVVMVWTFLFSLSICIYVRANITIIEEKLLQLEDNLGNSIPKRKQSIQTGESEKNKQHNFIIKRRLIKIIKYYQHLFETIRIIIPFIETMGNIYLVICIANAPGLFYTMQNQEKLPGYWYFQLKTLGLVTAGLSIMYTIMYCAQVISDMQTDIRNAVYYSPWYNQNTEIRKLIIQFQILLQTPFELKAFGIYPINRNLFTSSMRMVYSLLNLMYTLL